MNNIFIDCGTHMGLGFSRLSEELNIDNTWKVFGFEANPFTFEQYRKNLLSGNYPTLVNKNIEIFNKAVWVIDDIVEFSLRGISENHYESIYSNSRDKNNPFYKNDWEPGLANLAADVHKLPIKKIIEIPWDGGSCLTELKNKMKDENKNSEFYKWHEQINIQSIDISKWIMNNFSKDDHIVMKMDIEGAEYDVLTKMIDDKSIEYINILYVEWHDWQLIDKIHETQNLKNILNTKLKLIDWH